MNAFCSFGIIAILRYTIGLVTAASPLDGMNFDFGAELRAFLGEAAALFDYCGHISKDGTVRPLRPDSKVLSALFEDGVADRLVALAELHGFTLEPAPEQNYYPDFTLTRGAVADGTFCRVAVDVKTTYVGESNQKFKFTLGSFTGYLQVDTPEKNCTYPYDTYTQHLVVCFVYKRAPLAAGADRRYALDELDKVPVPLKDVRCFVQEKWRIAGDRKGSGNTGNIGSIEGLMRDFVDGKGVFADYDEFLSYWRSFGKYQYKNITDFRTWAATAPPELVSPAVLAAGRTATPQLGLF